MGVDRQALIEALGASEALEMQALAVAVEEAKRRMMGEPTQANVRGYDEARKLLLRFQAEKAAAMGLGSGGGRAFKSLYSSKAGQETVLTHLTGLGFKVAKTRLYDATKDQDASRRLERREDGLFHAADAEAWAVRVDLPRVAQASAAADTDELVGVNLDKAREKLRAERLDNELRELRLRERRGELIAVQEYNDDFAAAAAILKHSGLQFFEVNVSQVVYLAGGDPLCADKVKLFLQDKFQEWLHGFSRHRELEILRVEDDEDRVDDDAEDEGDADDETQDEDRAD